MLSARESELRRAARTSAVARDGSARTPPRSPSRRLGSGLTDSQRSRSASVPTPWTPQPAPRSVLSSCRCRCGAQPPFSSGRADDADHVAAREPRAGRGQLRGEVAVERVEGHAVRRRVVEQHDAAEVARGRAVRAVADDAVERREDRLAGVEEDVDAEVEGAALARQLRRERRRSRRCRGPRGSGRAPARWPAARRRRPSRRTSRVPARSRAAGRTRVRPPRSGGSRGPPGRGAPPRSRRPSGGAGARARAGPAPSRRSSAGTASWLISRYSLSGWSRRWRTAIAMLIASRVRIRSGSSASSCRAERRDLVIAGDQRQHLALGHGQHRHRVGARDGQAADARRAAEVAEVDQPADRAVVADEHVVLVRVVVDRLRRERAQARQDLGARSARARPRRRRSRRRRRSPAASMFHLQAAGQRRVVEARRARGRRPRRSARGSRASPARARRVAAHGAPASQVSTRASRSPSSVRAPPSRSAPAAARRPRRRGARARRPGGRAAPASVARA